MKVLIVSGFLGAGKTTFIKEMVKRMPYDFAVMENEYGEIGLDKKFLNDGEKLNVWELSEGCVCCTIKADFVSNVLTIANAVDPEYMIVEPTGLALLSNIINNIKRIEYERIKILKPVVILDANCFELQMKEQRDIFLDQIKNAGTVVVSKNDLSSYDDSKELLERIAQINPDAKVRCESYYKADEAWWRSLLNTMFDGSVDESAFAAAPPMDNFSLNEAVFANANDLLFFLEQIIRGEFGGIVRAKGIADVGNCLLRFDVVNDRYSVCGYTESEESGAVFIGKEISRSKIRKRLMPMMRNIRFIKPKMA